MNSENNDLVWDIIGENQFCCFKKKTIVKNFCKHEFNITGLCSRQSCPLANSKYATIIQQEGIFFLVQKDEKNLNFPNKIWKKIALSRNFGKAIQEINLNLAFWPKFFLYFAKLKLTRLTQIFLRFRINELKKTKEFFLHKKSILFHKKNIGENFRKLEIEKSIEIELLNRLNLGVYGRLYSFLPIQIEKTNSFRIKKKKKILSTDQSFSYNELKKI